MFRPMAAIRRETATGHAVLLRRRGKGRSRSKRLFCATPDLRGRVYIISTRGENRGHRFPINAVGAEVLRGLTGAQLVGRAKKAVSLQALPRVRADWGGRRLIGDCTGRLIRRLEGQGSPMRATGTGLMRRIRESGAERVAAFVCSLTIFIMRPMLFGRVTAGRGRSGRLFLGEGLAMPRARHNSGRVAVGRLAVLAGGVSGRGRGLRRLSKVKVSMPGEGGAVPTKTTAIGRSESDGRCNGRRTDWLDLAVNAGKSR